MPKLKRPSRNVLTLAVATLFGLGAAWLASQYLDERVADIELRQHQLMTQAVVAKIDLPAGAIVDDDTVAVRELPAEWLHSAAISPDQFERAAGAVLTHPARAGEALIWPQLEDRRKARFASDLAPGRRAATIAVDEISAISGLLRPGDTIDLLATVQRERHTLTLPLMQAVRVLATGSRTRADSTDTESGPELFDTITLDLSPEDAARVIAARTIGKLTAVLRNPGDSSRSSTLHTDSLALLGLAESPARAAQTVPVIYGGTNNPRLNPAGNTGPDSTLSTAANHDQD